MINNKVCAIISNTTNSMAIPPLTDRRSISTLPFGCKYRMLDFPLSSVMNAGVDSVYMILSPSSSQSVYDHVGSGREWGFDGIKRRYFMHIVQKEEDYVGEKYYDSLIDYLKKSDSHYTIYMSTNMVCNIDFRKVLTAHHKEGAAITAVYKKVPKDQIYPENDILHFNEFARIELTHKFEEEVATEQNYNLSLNAFVVETQWLIQRLKVAKLDNEVLNGREILLEALHNEEDAYAYEYSGYLSNIFDVGSYYQSNMDMLNYKKMRTLLLGENKIFTKLKNEAPTYYGCDADARKSQFGAGCIIEGSVYNSLLSRNIVAEEGTEISNSIVMSGAKIGKNVVVRNAIIDKNVTVEDGSEVIGTPVHPIIVVKGSSIKNNGKGRVTA